MRKMIWIDLETTGLDYNNEVPLELGLAISDPFGNILAKKSWLIYEVNLNFKRTVSNATEHPTVGPMHTSSGLWDDLSNHLLPAAPRSDTDLLACKWLTENNIPEGVWPMAGSSIGSLDRPFVQIHLPRLNQFFSYRNIDISTIKEIARGVNREVYNNRPISDNPGHRVLCDIDSSIQEYRYYLDNFLTVAGEE